MSPGVKAWGVALVCIGIVAAAAVPSLYTALSHDRLLSQTDTREDLLLALTALPNESPSSFFGGRELFDPDGALMRTEAWFIRPSSLGSFTTELDADLSQDQSDLIIFDSFSHDRLLYEPKDHPLQKMYLNYGNLTMIRISPFSLPKEKVPFSPESLFSPYLPDLPSRNRPGPFIEMYFRERSVADRVHTCYLEQGIDHLYGTGGDGYYFTQLNDLYGESKPSGQSRGG